MLAPYPDAVLIGEASADTPGGAQAYCGSGNDELHQVFDFRLLKSAWRADRFRRLIQQIDEATPVGSWPTVVLSNHDQSRHIDRYGRGGVPERRARAAAVLLFTLRGTPFLYYGEELGMRDGELRDADLRDPYTKRFWPFRKGRDPSRTPMQWDRSAHAEFTTGQPWLPVSANFPICNVDSQLQDSHSLLAVYRRLIQLRNASPALLAGTMTVASDCPEDCIVYQRLAKRDSGELDRVLVAVNFADRPVQSTLRSIGSTGTMIFSTDPNRAVPASFSPSRIELGPDEAVIIQFADSPFSESL